MQGRCRLYCFKVLSVVVDTRLQTESGEPEQWEGLYGGPEGVVG